MATPDLELIHSPEMQGVEIAERRLSAEVYQEFYEKYGAGFVDDDGNKSMQQVVDGRVLHIDGPRGRSVHLIVHEMTGHFGERSTPGHDGYGPYVSYGYDAGRFVVATTDGQEIREWRVVFASGMHRGYVNAIDYPYQAENEVLHLSLGHEDAEGRLALDLSVRRVSMEGTMSQPDGSMGWILGEEESRMERDYALTPDRIVEFPHFVGHVATRAS